MNKVNLRAAIYYKEIKNAQSTQKANLLGKTLHPVLKHINPSLSQRRHVQLFLSPTPVLCY